VNILNYKKNNNIYYIMDDIVVIDYFHCGQQS
jgi:hypothetical protein